MMIEQAGSRMALAMAGAIAIVLGTILIPTSWVQAASLRRGGVSVSATGGDSADTFFSGYFDFGTGSTVDNILRLENPTSTNGNICAMIYVFDAREEMGECCGCLLTPNQMLDGSVKQMIGTQEWAVAPGVPVRGVLQIVSALPNASALSNKGNVCSPSQPYIATPTLNGWITHVQTVSAVPGLTEVSLTDNGSTDATEGPFLINLCGEIIGNGTGAGICVCPPSSDD
jgi:hypothetical protein